MAVMIHLYPIFTICITVIGFDLAMTLRRKGKAAWLLVVVFVFVFVTLVFLGLWVYYRGDKNAMKWAKEWVSLIFSHYTLLV